MLQESEKEHGALDQRLIDIDKIYEILAELERDLVDLRKRATGHLLKGKIGLQYLELPPKKGLKQ